MEYDAIIVGAGITGLTSAAFLSKAGMSVLLCEKEEKCGGLINSFERDGFIYDGGIRAFENSGVLLPMLRQLDIKLNLVPNRVSMGIEDKVMHVKPESCVDDYRNLLLAFYPQQQNEIEQIIIQIRLIMKYMEVQYGIDNPMFLDMKKDQEYMLKEIVPWMFKYAVTAPKIAKMITPVVEFLSRYTSDQSLLDIITQHFFRDTPAYFALSYLKLYLDYHYPLGGTGSLVGKLTELISQNQGVISTNTEIVEVDVIGRKVKVANGDMHHYRRLIWAADLNTLFRLLDSSKIADAETRQAIFERQEQLAGKAGNDSVYTMYLGVNLDREYFSSRCSEHFFYTPSRAGQSAAGPIPTGKEKKVIKKWLEDFLKLTTYEISIPVLRDRSMAPEGKTGLIISALFDYHLTRQIGAQGWYEEFKALVEQQMMRVLDSTIYPGIAAAVVHVFSSTPLTMAKLTGNHEGAITGWSFTTRPVPAESRIPRIMNAIKTPIPGVYQAGQWTYSPSGLPISLLTGKIAADRVIKDLKQAL